MRSVRAVVPLGRRNLYRPAGGVVSARGQPWRCITQPLYGPHAHTALGFVSLIVNDCHTPGAISIESAAWPVFVFVKKLTLIRRSVLKSVSVSVLPLMVNVPVPMSVVFPPLHCTNR